MGSARAKKRPGAKKQSKRSRKAPANGWGWGGWRPGAGRPKKPDAGVSHLARPRVQPGRKLEITMRFDKSVGSLLDRKVHRIVHEQLDAGHDRFGLKILDYSIERCELHLTVSAKNSAALSKGMQGLSIRLARAINRARNRTGQVFSDRYEVRSRR